MSVPIYCSGNICFSNHFVLYALVNCAFVCIFNKDLQANWVVKITLAELLTQNYMSEWANVIVKSANRSVYPVLRKIYRCIHSQ